MEQVIMFKNEKGNDFAEGVDEMLKKVNEWLEKNSDRVVSRHVSMDGLQAPLIIIFYNTNKPA